jgi:hypothetical protein
MFPTRPSTSSIAHRSRARTDKGVGKQPLAAQANGNYVNQAHESDRRNRAHAVWQKTLEGQIPWKPISSLLPNSHSC